MERFWSKVNKQAENGCWEWTASKRGRGYGQFKLDGTMATAHRVSWMLEHGPIPAGEGYHGTCVLHRCDNPPCVNPDHLFLGTNADNMRDMAEKGRQDAAGESNGRAKLTEADVHAIRADNRSPRAIAAEYGVSQNQISLIKNRKRWTHI
jgi:hypothetical protein